MTDEIRDILSNIGYSLKDFGLFFRAKPLYRESGNDTSLSICKKTGRFYDFSINIHGSLEELVKLTLKLKDIDEARGYLKDKIDLSKLIQDKPKIKFTRFYPNELLNELLDVKDYWKNRGVSVETLNQFKGGLAEKGQMKGRYVFPIFNDQDKIIGFIGRTINDKISPKYKIIGEKNSFIWPNKNHTKEFVILVESPACVLRLYDYGITNVLCLFGTNISKKIILYLIKKDFRKIYISTNNEPDNQFIGNAAAIKIKEELVKYFDEEQVSISLPTKKDFAEMDTKEIKQWYDKSCK